MGCRRHTPGELYSLNLAAVLTWPQSILSLLYLGTIAQCSTSILVYLCFGAAQEFVCVGHLSDLKRLHTFIDSFIYSFIRSFIHPSSHSSSHPFKFLIY